MTDNTDITAANVENFQFPDTLEGLLPESRTLVELQPDSWLALMVADIERDETLIRTMDFAGDDFHDQTIVAMRASLHEVGYDLEDPDVARLVLTTIAISAQMADIIEQQQADAIVAPSSACAPSALMRWWVRLLRGKAQV